MVFSDPLLTPRALCNTASKLVLPLFPLTSLLSRVFYIFPVERLQNRMKFATIT